MRLLDNDLFYTCSLIEFIGRTLRQRRGAVVQMLGEKNIRHIYQHAGTLHCEPIAQTADAFIELCNLPTGDFDNVAACKYAVPTYWDIGKVYARLIEDIQEDGNLIHALQQVYDSPIGDAISNYNGDLFYQSRDLIREEYRDWKNGEGDFAEAITTSEAHS